MRIRKLVNFTNTKLNVVYAVSASRTKLAWTKRLGENRLAKERRLLTSRLKLTFLRQSHDTTATRKSRRYRSNPELFAETPTHCHHTRERQTN